jgi:excisionase family DNA binding protein
MNNTPIAYSIKDACEVLGTGRTSIYEEISTGRLRAVKRGRRTLILADDLRKYVADLPTVRPSGKTTPSLGVGDDH